LCYPQFGVQDEAQRLLRSISAGELNEQILEARRTFDAGVEAFLSKNFQRALFLFQAIEPTLLPDQYQARLRDFMSMREMDPRNFAAPEVQLVAGQRENLKGQPIQPNA